MAAAAEETLNIALLGPPSLTVGNAAFVLAAPPKALALLALLVANRGLPCRRDAVANALWPDEEEERARANLRRHLHRLQKALPTIDVPWLIAEATTVRWNCAAPAKVDAIEYEALLQADRLEEAVRLYRGDFLQGVDDESALPHRERFRDLQDAALTRLARRARAASDHHAVVEWTTRMLRLDPFREEALRWNVAAKWELGDLSGALLEYDRFVARLSDEIGVDPAAETIAMHDALIRHGGIRTASPAAPSTQRLPFVGRERHLQRLVNLWNGTVRGGGHTVLVHGEAGIGKSRLAAEFRTIVEAQGARVLEGGTRHPESQPYQCVAEALREALTPLLMLDIDPLYLSVAGTLVSDVFTQRPGLSKPPRIDPARDRSRLFESVAAIMCALAASRPLLVLFEDVHWASADTAALIEYLARRIASEHVLVLVTYRDEETAESPISRVLDRLIPDGLATSVPLPRLSKSDVRLMWQAAREHGSVVEDAEALYRLTEGNPLFVEEALLGTSAGQPLPVTVAQSVERRIAAVSSQARDVAECASVIGRTFDARTVARMLAWPEDEVVSGVDELLDSRLIRFGSGRDAAQFAFAHHSIQRAISELAQEDRLRAYHLRAAREFERQGDRHAANVAHHLENANRFDEAASAYARAAAIALRLGANEHAAFLTQRGLDISQDSDVRFEIGLHREEALRRLGQRDLQRIQLIALERAAADNAERRAIALSRRVEYALTAVDRAEIETTIEQLEQHALSHGDARTRADVVFARARAAATLANPALAERLLLESLGAYRALGDRRAEAAVLFRLAELYPLLSRVDEADALLQRSLHLAREIDEPLLTQQALAASAINAHHSMKPALAGERARELLALAEYLGDREGQAQAHQLVATAAAAMMRHDTALEHFRIAEEMFSTLNLPHGRASALINMSVTYHLVGKWQESLGGFEAAIKLLENLGDGRRMMSAVVNAAVALIELGDLERAAEYAQRAVELARASAGQNYLSVAFTALGTCERERGNYSTAVTLLEQAVSIDRSIANPLEMPSKLCELALAYVCAERLQEAQELVQEIEAFADEHFSQMAFPQLAGYAAYCVRQRLGHRTEAARALERARAHYAERLAAISQSDWRDYYRKTSLNRRIEEAG